MALTKKKKISGRSAAVRLWSEAALLLGGWEALSAVTSLWGPEGRARLFLLSLGNSWYLLM